MSTDAYDFDVETGNTMFLEQKLKSKGDSVDVRIGGAPVHEPVVWRQGEQKPIDGAKVAALSPDKFEKVKKNKKYRVSHKFTWPVIDRDTGDAGTLTLPLSVYREIKKLAKNEKWGDPTKYDLTITRTEESPANYYSVVPDPQKSDLTDEEVEALSGIDLSELKPHAKATSTFGEDAKPAKKSESSDELDDDDDLESEEAEDEADDL